MQKELPPKTAHVILDRDGVLNREAPGGYVREPSEWIWLPGALRALSLLVKAGIALSVATNQSCVGRGIISIPDLEKVHGKMRQEAAANGICFQGIHFCPHLPGAGCICRKPAPGLIERAVAQSGIPKYRTLFIGDAPRDLLAGRAAGIRSWLVRTGKGLQTEADLKKGAVEGLSFADIQVFNDLGDAAHAILQNK